MLRLAPWYLHVLHPYAARFLQRLPVLGMGATGLLVGFAFFVLMSIAAAISSISMLEVPVSYAVEAYQIDRHKSTWLVGLVLFDISALICFNFDWVFAFVIAMTTERA